MITAKHIMSKDVIVVPEDMGVRELAGLLTERMITGAPVVDGQGRLIGVVSSMDVVRFFGNESRGVASGFNTHPEFYVREWNELVDSDELRAFHVEEYGEPAWVSDIMTPVVFDVSEDTPLADIAATMVHGRIHRVIVTRNRRVVGIVTSLDVLKAVAGSIIE